MKTAIIFIAVTVITTAALRASFIPKNNCVPLAQKVITALRTASPEAYVALFPSLDEFHALMDENALVYGGNLAAAKEEFAARYNNDILPSLKKSFVSILQDGNKKGIDWSHINFERVECSAPGKNLAPVPFTIVFSANKKEYHVTIDKAFVLHDEWKVSPEISLTPL